MGRFGSVLVAMVTPFDDELELDLDAAAELARWLVDQGADGLVLAGTTGEAPTLSDDEAVDLWTAIVTGLTDQQISNDPGGDRWTRLVDRAVDMFFDQFSRTRGGAP